MSATTKTADLQPTMTENTSQSVPKNVTVRALDRLASWRVWAMSAMLFVPFALVFFASSAPFSIANVESTCGQAPPDMRFFTTGNDVVGFLDACGPAGRTAYQNMQLADLFYPAIVGVFLASSLALAIRRLSPGAKTLRWLAAVPLLAAIFDYVENALAWLAIAAYPGDIITNDILGFASAAKTATSWASGLGLLTCLAILGARACRRRMGSRRSVASPQAPKSEYSTLDTVRS